MVTIKNYPAMIDITIRKYALIEYIMQLESDSDVDAMEKVAATLKSATISPVPKPKTRKPKKEVPQSDTLTEKEAKNYILRYNNLLDVYVKIPKEFEKRISKTIDLEEIKRKQNYKPINRAELDKIIDKINITEPIEDLLEMLKK